MPEPKAKIRTDIYIPHIYSEDTENGRFYVTPNNDRYPSITTILSEFGTKNFLDKWKSRIGKTEAERITKQAGWRGNGMHELIESYFKGEDIKNRPTGFINFIPLLKYLKNISEIYFQEAGLYSDVFRIAGRTDLLGIYNGIPSVVDFKTSRREKRAEWIEKYFIQGCFYSEAFKELTNGEYDLKQIVILISNDNGTANEYVVNKEDYYDKLVTVVDYYEEYKKNYTCGSSTDCM